MWQKLMNFFYGSGKYHYKNISNKMLILYFLLFFISSKNSNRRRIRYSNRSRSISILRGRAECQSIMKLRIYTSAPNLIIKDIQGTWNTVICRLYVERFSEHQSISLAFGAKLGIPSDWVTLTTQTDDDWVCS